MKNRNLFVTAMLAVTLVFGMMVMGCGDPDPKPDPKVSLSEVKTELKGWYNDNRDEFSSEMAKWKGEGAPVPTEANPNNWTDAQWNSLYSWLDSEGYLEGQEEEGSDEGGAY